MRHSAKAAHPFCEQIGYEEIRLDSFGPSHPSDATLVEQINAGDERAFTMLYERYKHWVVNLSYRFTGNAEDALDVLQETFAYLLRKSPQLTLTARMTTFLYPVVRNLSLEMRRKRKTIAEGESLLASLPAASLPHPELDQVVRRLPVIQQEVVLMRFVDDLTIDEIAQALEIPPGTVKSRLHHALQSLREDPRTRVYFEEK